ncbi:MAG: UbiA family prenyltransferase, partial [Acetobacter sp.]|nr:UbiA family prenyltransferase [Acetobacter sp.]
LFLVAFYPLAKRFTWWPQLVMGFTFGFGAPLGYAAAAGQLAWAQATLYGATIVWQLGFDTIYGFQDMEDDARIGVKSTSRLMRGHARLFIGCCYSIMLVLLGISALLSKTSCLFWLVLLWPAFLLMRQVFHINPHNPVLCLHQFQANREIGLTVALAFLAGLVAL